MRHQGLEATGRRPRGVGDRTMAALSGVANGTPIRRPGHGGHRDSRSAHRRLPDRGVLRGGVAASRLERLRLRRRPAFRGHADRRGGIDRRRRLLRWSSVGRSRIGRRGGIGHRRGIGRHAACALSCRGWVGDGRRFRTRRQEVHWIQIALRIGGRADSEVDVRLGNLRVVRRSGGSDDRGLVHRGATPDAQRAEMEERHGRSVRGADRDRSAAARDRPRERHDAGGGRPYLLTDRASDVDASVLARGVRVRAVETEAA